MLQSEGYFQLAGVFESLEKTGFKANREFGPNITGCFRWYLSPIALNFLEKNAIPQWEALKNNKLFNCVPEDWDGHNGKGMDIRLNY